MEQTHTIVNNSAPRCPYCHETVDVQSTKLACLDCMAWHHRECWDEHGKCSSCGSKIEDDPILSHSNQGPKTAVETPNQSSPNLQSQTCSHKNCQSHRQTPVRVKAYKEFCTEHATLRAQHQAKIHNVVIVLLVAMTLAAPTFSYITEKNADVAIMYGLGLFASLILPAAERERYLGYVKKLRSPEEKK